MTDREKVVKGLETCLDVCSGGDGDCSGCPYSQTNGDRCLAELVHDAIDLLNKQEAVEPKYIDGKRNHFILCGNCNTDLMRGIKYCSYCGRAVKWE